MAANDSPLDVQGLTKNYPSFTLQSVSFSLRPGAITGFIGRNGAGKTTTLNSILGYVKKDAGEVRFWGLDMERDADRIKQRIGFVSAGMTYYTRKPLKAITAVTRSFYPAWDGAAYQNALKRFGLEESKTPAALSNGMKIKYALALALSHRAELLILDEPTSGLDPVSREELVEIFLKLRDEGKTILFSTHITSDLEKCADQILFIQKGRLTADMPIDEFTDAYRLLECEGDVPAQAQALSLGERRTRKGRTVLIRRQDAQAAALPVRRPELEEIMVHLEKEEER
ncbi:MAG: ABC transporter ATP-binding protein [Clostridia bacterium]|nr:ABC transporter ATP-binding protein [Clostridia bacterium]